MHGWHDQADSGVLGRRRLLQPAGGDRLHRFDSCEGCDYFGWTYIAYVRQRKSRAAATRPTTRIVGHGGGGHASSAKPRVPYS